MTDRYTVDTINSDQLDALYDERDAWRHKAVRRTLHISKLQGTLTAVTDLANEEIPQGTDWSVGYRAALADLREVLREFRHRDDEPFGLAANEATEPAWRAEDHAGHGSPCEGDPQGSCAGGADSCRSVEVDGEVVLMRGTGEFTEEEQQFAAEIVRAAKRKYAEEHAEPDAKQLRALAFNAVLPALRTRGEWLPLTARRAVADAVLDLVLPAARIAAALARDSEATVQRVITLHERWCAAGPPPLGTSMSRWWDARLVELHNAILPPEQQPTTAQIKEQ